MVQKCIDCKRKICSQRHFIDSCGYQDESLQLETYLDRLRADLASYEDSEVPDLKVRELKIQQLKLRELKILELRNLCVTHEVALTDPSSGRCLNCNIRAFELARERLSMMGYGVS